MTTNSAKQHTCKLRLTLRAPGFDVTQPLPPIIYDRTEIARDVYIVRPQTTDMYVQQVEPYSSLPPAVTGCERAAYDKFAHSERYVYVGNSKIAGRVWCSGQGAPTSYRPTARTTSTLGTLHVYPGPSRCTLPPPKTATWHPTRCTRVSNADERLRRTPNQSICTCQICLQQHATLYLKHEHRP